MNTLFDSSGKNATEINDIANQVTNLTNSGVDTVARADIAKINVNGTKNTVPLPTGELVNIPATNLELWFKADSITGVADGEKVTTWNDDSGNGFNITTSLDINKPTLKLNQRNGLPSVNFDQSGAQSQRLYNNNNLNIASVVSTVSVYMVARKPTTLVTRSHWLLYLIMTDNSAVARLELADVFGASALRVTGEALKTITPPQLGLTRAVRNDFALYEAEINYADGNCKLYQDGRLIKTDTLTSAGTASLSSCKLTVGNYSNTADMAYGFDGEIGELMMYSGSKSIEEKEEIQRYLMNKWGIEETDGKYTASFTTTKSPSTLSTTSGNLSLIGTKKFNSYVSGKDIITPDIVGYLYLDEPNQKLYYSAGKFDNPVYLCDWNATIAGGTTCQTWIPIITEAGDIIFLKQLARSNPIVYPANNYTNPVVIDFGADPKPCGHLSDGAYDVDCVNDCIIFGEYFNPPVDGNPIYAWKIIAPYTAKANWTKVKTMVQRFTAGAGGDPTNEINHFHTVRFDHYSGAWVVGTGDADYRCRIITSIDGGVTWVEKASGSQSYRIVDLIFEKNYVYYATDTKTLHELYRFPRDVSGYPDFTKPTFLSVLGFYEPTYRLCLVREPHGVLMLDHAESRTDYMIDLMFWSIDDGKLYRLGIYNQILATNGTRDGLLGFGVMATTNYQPTSEDGIVCGGNSNLIAPGIMVDVLNNTAANRLGNVKIKVNRAIPK